MRKGLLLLIFCLLLPCAALGECRYDLSQSADQFKLLGRSYVTENGIACDLTASGVEFEAEFSGVLCFEVVNASAELYFSVFVDGEPLDERFWVPAGERTVVQLPDLGESELRTIKIAKQTEFSRGYCELASITLDGEVLGPTEDSDSYIEFIGDSLTSGYGNLLLGDPTDGSRPGWSINCDGMQTYATLACDILNADCSVVSCSGIGLQQGYVDFVMKDFYLAASYLRDNGARAFDFTSARRPDVVVVNLGTNDQAFLERGSGSKAAFEAGVYELVEIIRNAYGQDTPILWIYGMNGDSCAEITQAVWEALGGEEQRLYLLELPYDDQGGNRHPSLDAHCISAEMLAAELEDILYEIQEEP